MQWARAHRLAFRDGEASLVDLRLGNVYAPPLHADEWGTFDVVHARFVLEHLPDPLAAVKVMMRALRPGGRMILQEPDHSLIRLRPEPAGFAALWRAYLHVYSELGCNPNIGCDIVGLLHAAGMRPQRSTVLFSGGCAGDEHFHAHARHFADMVNGAHDRMLATGTIEPHELQQSIRALYHWCHQDGVALWMPFTWAAAIRP
jgi:SAM-dependent methyltransferase